ncbi:flagellar protein FlaG [Lederbergia graminis]|uniref:Flagellar protein FlaG n=1 Tax=Lederbergia graminis TaxID=735518 RepID=A0ABW0LME8_9BACI
MVGQITGQVSTSVSINKATEYVEKVMNVNNQVNDGFTSEENRHPFPSAKAKENVRNVVNSMNDFLVASPNTHLKFEFHEQLDEYYVTLINEETKEVVREIPPKKMLDMFAAMTEFLGLMVDKKV